MFQKLHLSAYEPRAFKSDQNFKMKSLIALLSKLKIWTYDKFVNL